MRQVELAPGGDHGVGVCLDENLALDLLHGLLPAAERARVLAHIDRCSPCRVLVSELLRAATAGPGGGAATAMDDLVHDLADLEPSGPPSRGAPPGRAVGRYIVHDLIGAGGMGVVYAAYDPQLRRKVALKLLRVREIDHETGRVDELRARLVREAQALALVSHPNVIAVHDVSTDGEDVFIAMELVDGCTLTEWLSERPRPWREMCDVFGAAGRGLAAAHAAGLVHRDFKPDNVLVGHDGRVRVTDFGLARAAARPDGAGARAADGDGTGSAEHAGEDATVAREEMLTRTGSLLGTPAYMAPEQREGLPADARSDQYSFCAALHEALWGDRPRGLPTRIRLGHGALGRIPVRLRRLVARGTAIAPADRFASMDDIVRELDRAPRRIFLRVAAAAALPLALGVGVLGWTSSDARPERALVCRGAERHLAGVWDPARKDAVRRALLGSGAPFAPSAWRAVEASLDGYAGRWVAMHTDACEASAVRREQPPSVLALRMSCLDQRRQELEQAALQLSDPATPIARAVQVSQGMTHIEVCADVGALSAPLPPPSDPAVRARVDELQRRLAAVKAKQDAGLQDEAIGLAGALVEPATALSYPPLLARVYFRLGVAQLTAMRPRDAEQNLYQAIWAAEAAREDEVAARAWTALVYLIGAAEGRPADADAIVKHAGAAIERLQLTSPRLAAEVSARLVANRSSIEFSRGEIERSVELARLAIRQDAALNPDDPGAGRGYMNLAASLQELGKLDEALDAYREAERILRRSQGDGHPDLLNLDSNMGILLWRLGRKEEASALLEKTLAGARALGPDHQLVVYSLERLGDIRRAQGRERDALALIDEALALRRRLEATSPAEIIRTLTIRGDVLVELDRTREARRAYEEAVALGERELAADHPALAIPLESLGLLELDSGARRKGLATLERALAIDAGPDGDPTSATNLRKMIARARRSRRP